MKQVIQHIFSPLRSRLTTAKWMFWSNESWWDCFKKFMTIFSLSQTGNWSLFQCSGIFIKPHWHLLWNWTSGFPFSVIFMTHMWMQWTYSKPDPDWLKVMGSSNLCHGWCYHIRILTDKVKPKSTLHAT
jgi:hypothetical protein